ncbi:helix-turn-helix domain-containing protein [Streptomyces sp. NPDC088745]|uniref:helix-turn-helix domain-containing protein n=1 Tax=Streptomyces sp. NPDC088745 TaxID=3365884 RepID=UPI00381630A3
MTAQHFGMVMDAGGLDGPEKLLLGAYCNRTDDHGYCYPGQARLADDCGTSIATVKRVKARLVAKKLIKSVRRVNPRTGDPISNLTRVNLPLLASMRRPPREYDDNLMEALTFDDGDEEDTPLPQKPKKKPRKPQEPTAQEAPEEAPEKAPDLLMAQDEPDPETHADLLMAQDEPDPGSTWAQGGFNMSPTPVQDEPLTRSEPSEKPHGTLPPSVGSPSPTEGGTEKRAAAEEDKAPAAPVVVEASEGVEFLQELAAFNREMLLTGQVLADQGRFVQSFLDLGVKRSVLRQVLSRPLPPETRSVGGVIRGRLRALARTPLHPSMLTTQHGGVPEQRMDGPSASYGRGVEDLYTADGGPELLERRSRVFRECSGCGDPVFIDGDQCAKCAGYDRCEPCARYVKPGCWCPGCGKDPSVVEMNVCDIHEQAFVAGLGCFMCRDAYARERAAEVRRALARKNGDVPSGEHTEPQQAR